MDSILNLQFGEFNGSSPNWFDWFSLFANFIVSIISILGGYQIAKSVYNREKNDKSSDSKIIIDAEFALFKNSLSQLRKSSKDQSDEITKHLDEAQFDSLIFYQTVNVDFLQFIDAKNLYFYYNLDPNKIVLLNDLLKNLYALNDFRESLRSQFRAYNEKYNHHEKEFYEYRNLLYNIFYKLSNVRSISIELEEDKKIWKYDANDKFMIEYSSLIQETLSDKDIIENGELKSRKILSERFITNLITSSSKFIPEDYDAIEVNSLANKVLAAFNDMERVTQVHIRVLESHRDSLNNVIDRINEFE